jgi:hypothetical protein
MFGGIVWLFMSIEVHAGAEIVTVSAVPALAGSLLIAALTASFLHGIDRHERRSPRLSWMRTSRLAWTACALSRLIGQNRPLL